MPRRDPHDWMWAEAVAMLARAERGPLRHDRAPTPRDRMAAGERVARPEPAWVPAVDVIENGEAVMILVSLPGVGPDAVEAVLEDGSLVVSGRRTLPPELRTAVIHRLELPMGRFERRIPIPPGRYDSVSRATRDGCLLISLHKA